MNLSEIIESLEKLDATAEKEGKPSILELIKSDEPLNEITIFGNREGFIYLAMCCLSLAENPTRGAHYHFDQNSVFQRVDMPLIVARKILPSHENRA